ncbi:hypothetical protein OG599_09250 [Streptomyces sp. NBC_01335]|uniref:phage tail protein n=1 Tax=Streptomyces sp. NBC_01335 TaxID=2903828 RepID=UPI002E0DE589|nr:hypothetical protein OG599_09250 [Streptomyces sp. NBC_01335]
MSDANIVGRIAVKVMPDTSGFKKDLKEQLRRIESDLSVTIQTKADATGARRDVLQIVRDINRDNKATDARKIRFFTAIDGNGMARAVKEAAIKLREKAKHEKIDFKIGDVTGSGKIVLELDKDSADRAKDEIDRWRRSVSPVKVDIELNWPSAASAAVSARLGILTRPRTVPIIPDLDNAALAKVGTALAALSGARVLSDTFERLWKSIKNLDRSAPIIGTLATAIAGLAGWGLTAASNLFTLSASLASIAPTALLLPGLLGGMAVGLGVSIAALKDFNKVIPEVKSALSGLQDTISENFWAKAAEPIRAVVDDLLPKFRDGVSETATELGSFFGSFATNLGTSLSPALTQMFTDLSASISIATDGTDTFASIIATLGRVGTSYLPDLASWFVKISENFDAWLSKKGDNGLKDMIDEGIVALKDLGSIVVDIGGIFAGVARAAEEAGGSTLGTLADTLDQIHQKIDSSGVQDAMRMLFYSAHEAMNELMLSAGPQLRGFLSTVVSLLTSVLPQVGNIIGTALGGIADALNQPAITAGVHALFDGMQSGVEGLVPALAPLGAALGAVLAVVGTLVAQLGPLVGAALGPLARAFAALAPMITPIIELLMGALAGAFQQLTPIIQRMVPIVGQMLGAAFQFLATLLPPVAAIFTQLFQAVMPLGQALMSALAPVLPVLAAALQQVLAALQPIIAVALQIITAVIAPLLPMLSEVIQGVLPPLADAIQRLLEAIQPVLDALLAVVNFLMPVLVPVIKFIVELLAGALVAAVNGVALVFEGLVEIVRGVWDIIVGVLKMAWGLIEGLFTGNFSTLKAGWSQFWTGVWTLVKGVWDTILGALEAFLNIGLIGGIGRGLKAVGALFKSGWKLIEDLCVAAFAAIRGWLGVFMTGMRGLVSDGLSAIGRAFSSSWSSIRSAASSALSALVRTIGEWIGKAVTTVKELPGKAKSALGSMGSVLISAGKSLITGFVSGIKSMFSSVKSTLGSLTSKLTDWKGPAPKDAVLLYEAGRLIISGLIKGLESQYDAVKQSLNDLTAKIPASASKGLKARISSDRTQLLKLAAQWEAGASKLESARDKLDKIREEMADYASQVGERVLGTGDVTKVEDATFTGISASLKNAVEEAKRFAAVLKRLKTLGLNQATFDQIAMSGPEAGLAAAEAIANAGDSGVSEINALQKELEQYASSAGSTASHYMYDAGVQAAEGLVKGLEASQDRIEAQMLKIADAMVAAIKKALDIHSPSRLFRKLGAFVGKGFGLGVTDERGRVQRATEALAASATSAASREVTSAVAGGLSAAGASQSTTKVLNYYASNGSSLSSAEELFAAASRARMVGW